MNQKWKTLIVSVLTPSSIISGIALIVLWGYFSRLDRLDIFFDVMNIKSILVLVCCTTILSYYDPVSYTHLTLPTNREV